MLFAELKWLLDAELTFCRDEEEAVISNVMEVENDHNEEDEVTTDSFDRDEDDSDQTEDDSSETESEKEDDDDTSTEEEESSVDSDMLLEDDDDDSAKSNRRTGMVLWMVGDSCVATMAKNRRGRKSQTPMDEETDASSIVYPLFVAWWAYRVAQGNDVDTSLHAELILYRQTLPIYKWVPILNRMNTRYVTNGSRIKKSRWADANADSTFFSLFSLFSF